jgi:hypothetical protein
MKLILVLASLAIPLFVVAHREPTTPEEIEVQRSLQAAAYYVRPASTTILPFLTIAFDVQCSPAVYVILLVNYILIDFSHAVNNIQHSANGPGLKVFWVAVPLSQATKTSSIQPFTAI